MICDRHLICERRTALGSDMSNRKLGEKTVGTAAKTVSQVKGGWVKRDAKSGRFVEVRSETGTFRAKPGSEAAVKAASKERHDALKRLADR